MLAILIIIGLLLACWSVTARATLTVQGMNGTTGGIQLGGTYFDETAEGVDIIDISLSANQTDKQIDMELTTAGLGAIIIVVSQDMTLETNSSSTPADTFALKANRPFVWVKNTGLPNPFTANVTTAYLTNTTAGTFKAFVFKDMTP